MVQKLGLVKYDAAGNMLKDGVHTYAYDAENRISAVDGGSTATYTYDAQGGRAAKTVGSALTYYVRDLGGHVMSEYGCQTCWDVGYTYLNGGLTAIYESSTTYFVHGDHLGSTRLMTAYPTPSVAECDDYYPFGELISCGSTGDTTHKFTGKERDTESNLDNFEARYRSSTLGRFMSPDPGNIGADATNPQTWNMYSYVLNNPLKFIDPKGLYCYYGNTDPDSGDWSDDSQYDFDSSPEDCANSSGQWYDLPTDNQSITVSASADPAYSWWNAFTQVDWKKIAVSLNRCAAQKANVVSPARLAGNGKIAQALLGNSFSSLSQLALGPNRVAGAISTAVSGPQPNAINVAIVTAGAAVRVANPGAAPQVIDLGEGATATIIGGATKPLSSTGAFQAIAGDIVSVADGKIIYDGLTYIGAEAVCAVNGG